MLLFTALKSAYICLTYTPRAYGVEEISVVYKQQLVGDVRIWLARALKEAVSDEFNFKHWVKLGEGADQVRDGYEASHVVSLVSLL